MSKEKRAQKRAEEARIIAQMQSAMLEVEGVSQTENDGGKYETSAPETGETEEKIYCKRCKTLMKEGVCPVCGYRIYVPMEKGKIRKIRLIVAISCVAVFLLLFLILRMK